MTYTNLSRLAAWAGITPETHPDIFMEPFIYHDVYSLTNIEWCPLDTPNLPDPTDPGADPQIVDDVWLARVISTLTAMDKPSGFLADVRFVPQMGGGWYCTADAYVPNSLGRREHCEFGYSMTLALLRAARAAGVPEVVEAMGDDNNG